MEELGCCEIQRSCDLDNVGERDIFLSTLNHANVSTMNSRKFTKMFLAQPTSHSLVTNNLAKSFGEFYYERLQPVIVLKSGNTDGEQFSTYYS